MRYKSNDHALWESIRSAYVTKTWHGERITDRELASQFGVSEREVAQILGPIRRSSAKTSRKIGKRRHG